METLAIILLVITAICFIGLVVSMVADWMTASGIFIVATLVAFFTLITVVAIAEGQDNKRLIDQCIADGKKEYECRAMLKENHDIVPMPIVIPVR